MREPIEKDDIRAGDKVRVEFVTHNQVSTVSSLEYTARCDGMGMTGRLDKWQAKRRDYYLLERPAPAVALPTEPTLGWASLSGKDLLAVWSLTGQTLFADYASVDIHLNAVTAFTAAVAAPKAALDELRHKYLAYYKSGISAASELDALRAAIDTFLAAVDAANGADQ